MKLHLWKSSPIPPFPPVKDQAPRPGYFWYGIRIPLPRPLAFFLASFRPILGTDDDGREFEDYPLPGRRRRRVTYFDTVRDSPIYSVDEYDSMGHSRSDGPALVLFDQDGVPHYEKWMLSGKTHRLDGPAMTQRFSSGKVSMQWMVEGSVHRIDGPARLFLHSDGRRGEQWHFEGAVLEGGPADLATVLSALPPEDLRRYLDSSTYRLLLEEGVRPEEIVRALSGGVWTIEGIRQVLDGTPPEWVRSFETGETASS